jgi:hypothetical protein
MSEAKKLQKVEEMKTRRGLPSAGFPSLRSPASPGRWGNPRPKTAKTWGRIPTPL